MALSATERRSLRRLVNEEGENAVMSRSGLGRDSLARLLAGLGVRRGTVAMARAALTSKGPSVKSAPQ